MTKFFRIGRHNKDGAGPIGSQPSFGPAPGYRSDHKTGTADEHPDSPKKRISKVEAAAVAFGVVGAFVGATALKCVVQNPADSSVGTATSAAVIDPHTNAKKPPLSRGQASIRVKRDVKSSKGTGPYWVGGYVEDGETIVMGGSDINNDETYFTLGQAAKNYDISPKYIDQFLRGQDPNTARHRSVAETIQLQGSHTQKLGLAVTQFAIMKNIAAWNTAGHKVGTEDQESAIEQLDDANKTTRRMLEQLDDSLESKD